MTAPDQLGIWCRACGAVKLETIDSRPVNGGVKRTRRCQACGTGLISMEMVVIARVRVRPAKKTLPVEKSRVEEPRTP